MMILSRVWYVVLGVAVAVALYVVYVAVGQYNRQTARALKEGLASDSQTVEWALKIDARRRLDALLVGSVDLGLRQALVAANASNGKLPERPRAEAKKALVGIVDSIPADWRNDALFAVDRNGTVVAEIGYDIVVGNDDFELGGYPAVNDALHGWLRDDVWVLGSKMYAVVARPVEYVDYDPTQRPSGAIVGLKEVSGKFADDLAKRTRTNLAFFAAGKRAAAGTGVTGFDAEKLDAVGNDLKNVDAKTYGDAGRTDVRMLADDLGAMYARLPGDAWTLGAGFAVVRGRTILPGPGGFLSGADDLDKANVPWLLLVVVVLLATAVGVAFTLFEHSAPLREFQGRWRDAQARRPRLHSRSHACSTGDERIRFSTWRGSGPSCAARSAARASASCPTVRAGRLQTDASGGGACVRGSQRACANARRAVVEPAARRFGQAAVPTRLNARRGRRRNDGGVRARGRHGAGHRRHARCTRRKRGLGRGLRRLRPHQEAMRRADRRPHV